MADSVCDAEQQVKPPPKRRRILDPAAIVSVPVYSNKVSSSLQLTSMAAVFTDQENSDEGLWSRFSSRVSAPNAIDLSDSEEDDDAEPRPENVERAASCCPSPPVSPVQKQSRKVTKKISEINRKLRAVNSLMSPESRDRKSVKDDEEEEDDVIVVSPAPGRQGSPYSSAVREIPLKIRCRTDVHKIPVLSSTPLSDVLTRLSVILAVPPPRLLLLREEAELPTGATVGELGLGIADIIECVVMAAEAGPEAGAEAGGGVTVTVRLQSKDRDAAQEFSLPRDAPLGSIFSRYLSRLPAAAQKKVRFHFDGRKLAAGETPAQLDMEDGDIIEVWV